jgi:hypothetical protein
LPVNPLRGIMLNLLGNRSLPRRRAKLIKKAATLQKTIKRLSITSWTRDNSK